MMLDGAGLFISEFLASGDGPMADEDGDFSDWIEVHNPTGETVDLEGWHLTDDDGNLSKWEFPDVSIDSGGYLLVFASAKDRVNPASRLHTNFRLEGGGDYLALVQADGSTVVSQFGDDGFPKQFEDVSYGVLQGAESIPLIAEADTADVLVPDNASLGTTWTQPGFVVDGTWTQGPTGIGFDQSGGGGGGGVPVEGGTAVLRLDINDIGGESGQADTEDGFTMFDLGQNGGTFDGITVTLSGIGGATLDDRDRLTPPENPPHFTHDQIYDDFVFARKDADGAGMQVLLEGLAPNTEYEVKLWSFDTGSTNSRVSDWVETSGAEPVPIEARYTFDGANWPSSNDDYTMTAMLTSSESGQLRIRGTRNGGSSYGVFLNAIQVVLPGIAGLIRTDISDRMQGQHTSAYVRVPFEVAADKPLDLLSLRMMYDAGFVAYLNGQEVARRNAPGVSPTPPAFDASATEERTLTETGGFEQFNLTSYLNLLNIGGPNVLAIHGLNSTATDGDFLLLPELTATSLEGGGTRYFPTPTPEGPNGIGLLGFVQDTNFSIDRGFFDAPFDMVISTDTPGATILYTTDGSLPSATHGTRVRAPDPNTAPSATVSIATTSYVRAMAMMPGYLETNVDTQTYIFLDDVLGQNPTPGIGYPATWQSSQFRGDYQVDPEVVAQWDDDNPANTDFGIREALTSIPTMSIVMDHDDLWGSSKGIYNHATSRGEAWRRAGSVEYFDPATGREFQVNAGVQMHGGASRDNVRQLKHSFRLLFRDDFGPDELDFRLFNDSAIERINTLVLRACFTDGFSTRTAQGRYSALDSQYTRDVWMRDVQLAMGSASAHSTYVHLYINGLYWGLYNPTERPDDAFQEEYLGGDRDDYDIVKDFNELFRGNKTAWNAMFSMANAGLSSDAAYQRIQGNNPDGTPNGNYPNYLDVDNLIDFMILHLYGGAEDWPHHNWYAARDRVGETTGFKFHVWDQEIVLDGFYRDRTDVNNSYTPARLYSQLRANAEFRLRFADRLHKHLFNDGVLTDEKAGELWMARADEIEKAIIGESARWGDAREGITGEGGVRVPTMTVDHWRAERDNVLDNYFTPSRQLALSRFRSDNLYPSVTAPSFNQHGGYVLPGFELNISAPQGRVYYTNDGTDPRIPGGSISPSAILYDNSPLALSERSVVRARVRSGNTWSALNEAEFFVISPATAQTLDVTELNYSPHTPTADELADGKEYVANDFEFIELMNRGATPIDLAGVSFIEGVEFVLADGDVIELAPNELAVVVANPEAFEARYGTGIKIVGSWEASLTSLRNSGETIEIVDRFGQSISRFRYDDSGSWPGRADGKGSSLEVLDPAGDLEDSENWRSSAQYGGSPGFQGEGPRADIVVTEVFSHSDGQDAVDWLEIHNTTSEPIDIGGWYLSDSSANYRKFAIDPATTIEPGEYLVFDEHDFNPNPTMPEPHHFALNGAHGDDVWLVETDAAGHLMRFVDHVEFGAAANDESWGRWPDSGGKLTPMADETPGAENSAPRVGPLVISEIMYRPPEPVGNPTDFEFIEIYNDSQSAKSLTNWRIRGGIDFNFATDTTLASGATLVIVSFDVADVEKLTAFRDRYEIDGTVAILGGYSGRLDDDGERIELQRPGTPPGDEQNFIPRLLEDEVRFYDVAPWPTGPAGGGDSLSREEARAWGNDSASWTSATPTPGTVPFQPTQFYPGDANLDGVTDVRDFMIWNAHKFTSGTDWTTGDFNVDGVTDVRDFMIWNVHKFTSAPAPAPVDVALAETIKDGNFDRAEEVVDDLAWLSELDGLTATDRSPQHKSHAEATADKLLASYWP